MASLVTRLQLRDRARKRADMENSEFWTDAEVNTAINASLKRLYNFLLATYTDEYFVTSEDIATVAGQRNYALNATFYKLLGVDIAVGGTPADDDFFSLRKFQFAERNSRRNHLVGILDFQYRLHGSNVRIIPTPPASHTLRIWYIPATTELTTDAGTFDGVNGFEEWVVIDVAMKMLRSEESDTAELQQDRAILEQHIVEMAAGRDANEPEQVVDVEGVRSNEWWAFWGGR